MKSKDGERMNIISFYFNHGAGIVVRSDNKYYTVELERFYRERYKGVM